MEKAQTHSGLRYPVGVARHVSADGCQFVLEQGALERGQNLAFLLEGFGVVRGKVRWIVADRIGFAFDGRLERDAQRALAGMARAVHRVRFELAR
ncbi:PilZ domain-containing protein [Novosphingobium sp. 1949]|uniref:PilZ domain-containing protein n=1 Tax=Novosphingobium organovorum TaxID=2930092 RepID=A0ABT0BB33_9SPHN|nr:PilZ domain-containing protein [Novosphingobium organovorum]MCJ2182009.1 PilZ domain-containing protein [Novosphingobium organovorum]